LSKFASLEAQCAAIADDIAYNAHDIDDGLRSGLLSLDALEEVAITGDILHAVRQKYPALDNVRTSHEIVRRQITIMVEDVIRSAQANLNILKPQTLSDIHDAGRTIIGFSGP